MRDPAALSSHAESPFFRAEVEEILAAASCGPGLRVLDVGCGNGALVTAAMGKGSMAVGLDASREVVVAAKGITAKDAFVQASATHLPFKDHALDRLLTQHLIEHLHDPGMAVKEWHRVIRPGGRLIVLTPNARYPDPRIFDDPTHVRIFDSTSLGEILTAGGFRVTSVRTLFPFLRGHTVFGLRHKSGFSRFPPWASRGRSLIAAAVRP